MARRCIALFAAVFVAAGCGSASSHPSTMAGAARPEYTLQQVTAAFAAQGITLQQAGLSRRHLVVLKDAAWFGPFGYQRINHGEPSVTQFLVFVRDGPHSAQRGNVWVAYGDDQQRSVKAALHQLALSSEH